MLPGLGIGAEFLTGKHGPCPVCGGKDRWRWDNKDESGSFYCAGVCGAGDGIKLIMLRHGLEFVEAVKEIEKHLGTAVVEQKAKGRSAEQKLESLRRTWGAGEPVCLGNPAGAYLFRRTGLTTVNAKVLRYNPRCACKEGSETTFRPALLALVSDVDGVPVNILRTYLREDGTKADLADAKRTMEGFLPPGCAVRLDPAAAEMGVSTGLETSLSARRLFGLPVWATLNDGRMQVWKPPAGVRKVWIFGDADRSYTGQAASYALAKRLVVEKYEVEVRMPEAMGTDFNDVLCEHQRESAA
jgi:putative DNA primase/helicase